MNQPGLNSGREQSTELMVFGRRFTINGRLEPALENVLRSRWDFNDQRLGIDSFWIRLYLANVCPAAFPSETVSVTLSLPSGPLEIRALESEFWLGTTDVGLHLRLLEGGAELFAWGGEEALCRNQDLFHLGLTESLRSSGLMPMHASIAARDGSAMAFLGPSGRGKTTTLLLALEAGYQVVCEDLAWCDPVTLEVMGFDRGLRLLPDTMERFSALLGNDQPVWQGDKWFVAYTGVLFKFGAPSRVVVLDSIIALERDPDGVSRFESLSQREAALVLWEASGVPLSNRLQRQTSTQITTLISRLKAQRLLVGTGTIPFTSHED
jgi:hypothetical protein